MTVPLTIHNAEINTVSVEVKTLTVSGKQVTLAVFRQLRERKLVAEAGTLNGLPWGIVNYHPDKCGNDDDHIHVVWQDAQELCRSRVDVPRWWRSFYPESGDNLVQAGFCANAHQYPEWARRVHRGGGWDIDFRFDGLNCVANEVDPCSENRPYRATPTTEIGPCQAADFASLRAETAQEVEAEKARRHRHEVLWTELKTLPQLFIAV
jgi:hypothetical protein